MTDLISDGEEEDDEEEDKIEGELGVWYCVTSCEILISKLFSLESDEVSEEIAEGELDDASEDIVEEVDDSTVMTEKNELNRDEQVITDAIDDDGERPWFCTTFQCPLHLWHNMLHTHILYFADEEEKEYDDEDDYVEDKPTSYSSLSLLGLRKFFSRYFQQ